LEGAVLEVGAGASFLDEMIPTLISSDILVVRGVSVVLDAMSLPFKASTLRAIVMTNVFHHIPDVSAFLLEASRCVKPGGRLVMIEPWITPWSSFVYEHLHYETIDSSTRDWNFASTGPLSDANSALPWVVFSRDRKLFERKFSQWRIHSIEPNMPFSYLVSGGLSMRSIAPGFSFGAWRWIEKRFERIVPSCAMFARIVLHRENGHRNVS
jgi:SAM-dependent methyltransferase